MNRIQEVLNLKEKIFSDKLSKEETYLIGQVYFNTFGRRIKKSCSSCIISAYLELKKSTENKMNKAQRLFQIKEGEVLSMHGMAESYTNANLTNRGALTILKLNRGAIKFFTEFPDNWQELSEGFDLRMTEEQTNDFVDGNEIKVEEKTIAPINAAVKNTSDSLKAELSALSIEELFKKAKMLGSRYKEYKHFSKDQMVAFLFEKLK